MLKTMQNRVEQLFKDISSGKIKPQSKQPPNNDPGHCHIVYTAGKYTIGVFSDCNKWDYIEYVKYGGKTINFSYKPSDKELKEIWGFS